MCSKARPATTVMFWKHSDAARVMLCRGEREREDEMEKRRECESMLQHKSMHAGSFHVVLGKRVSTGEFGIFVVVRFLEF